MTTALTVAAALAQACLYVGGWLFGRCVVAPVLRVLP